MLDRPTFTKEQKKYLRFNLRWINNSRLDEWIEYLDEPLTNGYTSQTQQKNLAWFLPRPKPDHYKGGMPLYAEEWLIQLAKDILKRSDIDILNLFCGMNKYGLRIDIKKEVNPDIVADAHTFADNWNDSLFDLIIADPPYSDQEAKDLYKTGKLNYNKWTAQCDKVLRKGGLLVVYHKYVMPNPNPKKYEVVKRVFIGNRTRHLPRVAIFFRKKPEVGRCQPLDTKQERGNGVPPTLKSVGIPPTIL